MMLVSVVIPAYNAESTLESTLDSILAQTYAPLEIVIVNDGSIDRTKEILDSYSHKHKNVKYFSQENKGQSYARNRAIEASEGEFVAFMDADDIWESHKLEEQVKFLNKNPNIGMVYTEGYTITEDGARIAPFDCLREFTGDCYEQLAIENSIIGSTVMTRRSVLDDVGCFCESLGAAENWNLWLRISSKYKIDFLPDCLSYYRKHGGNMTSRKGHMLENRLIAIKKNFEMTFDYRGQNRKLENASYYQAYSSFGRAFLGDFEFVQARSNILNAIKLRPLQLQLYGWLVQTFLSKGMHMRLRKLKSYIKK